MSMLTVFNSFADQRMILFKMERGLPAPRTLTGFKKKGPNLSEEISIASNSIDVFDKT